MKSELSIFQFESKNVRVILVNNESWFVGIDVAKILDYADTRRMCDLIDDEDKKVVNPHKMGSAILAESFGSNTFKVSIINESGLYACIFGSTKPEAKRFKKWVTSEVLPAIRKVGSYSIAEQPKLPQNYLEALKALVVSEEEKIVLQTKLIEAQPKIDYADAVACSDDCISMNEFAKLIGTGRTRLFKQLRELKVIMQSSTLPYQRFCDAGYFEVGQVITQYGVEPYALVTGKGQIWLCQKLGLTAKQSQLTLFN